MSFIQVDNPYKERIFIYGMIQQGKTVLAKYLVQQYDLQGIHTVVLDTVHNHKYTLKHGEIVKPPFARKEELFLTLCQDIWKKGNTVFVIEEIDQFCTPQYLPPELDSIIQMGANRNISLIATTRRVAEVHGSVVGNCLHHFIFKAFLPRDLEYYQKYVGKIVWQAKDLAPFHFIYYKVGGSPQICQPIPMRK